MHCIQHNLRDQSIVGYDYAMNILILLSEYEYVGSWVIIDLFPIALFHGESIPGQCELFISARLSAIHTVHRYMADQMEAIHNGDSES